GFTTNKSAILQILAAKLHLLSPLTILGRGYALAYGPDGQLLRRSRQVEANDQVHVLLHEGSLLCRVVKKEKKDGGEENAASGEIL
ncbi:MAG: exodeoxyribonuclease VII large subunit, partial [Peptococcaceae bacterium]|nr:exodeoxyribonuclease VII large subunit [Peptococcaceae bacterium]